MVEPPARSRSPPRGKRGRSLSRSRSRSRSVSSRSSRSSRLSRSSRSYSSYTSDSRSRSRSRSSSRSSRSSRSISRSASRSRSRSRSRTRKPVSAADPNNTKLFITPVSKNITADHLREIFGHFGTVTNVILPSLRGVLNLTGSPLNTGTAFVTLATRKEAESALEAMHEGWLDGHSIRVSFADPKADGREDRGRYRVDDKRRDARSRSRGRAPHYERNGDDRKDYIRDDRRIGRDDRRSFDYRAPDRRRDGYDDRRGGNRYDERRGVREHRSRSRSVGRDRRYR